LLWRFKHLLHAAEQQWSSDNYDGLDLSENFENRSVKALTW